MMMHRMHRPRSSAFYFWACFVLLTSSAARVTHAFQQQILVPVPPERTVSILAPRRKNVVRLYQSNNNVDDDAVKTSNLVLSVQDYLKEHHGMFFDLVLSKNDRAWKQLSQAPTLTIFAVTNEGMRSNVGETKCKQLADVRNDETVQRMAEYHLIADDAVSAQSLFDSGGVVTIGNNVVPVERTRTGGGGAGFLFGLMGGTEEEGGVTVGGGDSRVVSTTELVDGRAIVHATDNVVSPRMLWRYCDQLRIPGSK
jgi:uncharacterized surface protein with fasciclin (FAS1) repeats